MVKVSPVIRTTVISLAACLIALTSLAACARVVSDVSPNPVTPSAIPAAFAEETTAVSSTPTPLLASPPDYVTPTAFAEASPIPTATPAPAKPRPAEPPDRDLFDLAYRFGKVENRTTLEASPINIGGAGLEVGHRQEFFVNDLVDNTTYTIEATLLVVSENAYWYVDDAVSLSEDALSDAADVYEADIRQSMVASLGDIRRPGVDGDPRLTVLHTPLRAADGYFGSSDQYPQVIHPHSNQREMIYMDASRLMPGDEHYLSVLAHELQHAIHWNLDGGEDAWINEGMSELAKEQVGHDLYFVDMFLRQSEVQLNFWPDAIGTSGPHYGASSLFLVYLSQHYGGYAAMGDLVRDAADGVNGIENYLAAYGTSFEEVFKDWVIANYLDEESGAFSYSDRPVKVQSPRRIFAELDEDESLPQFAARYYDLQLPDGDYVVKFSGSAEVNVVDTRCHSGDHCWWSGHGDSIDSMLTREIDLTGLTHATLEFWTWYEIEQGWDYAYASVSTDGGERWTLLDGQFTTTDDPVGNNFGAGFSGVSGQWVRESMDLSRFAGQKIHLRFEYVTDDAVNLDGFLVDDIAVPELGLLDAAETTGDWRADGFQLIDNTLPQTFAVQIIEFGEDGNTVVLEMQLDADLVGEAQLAGFGSDLRNAVLVITPLTLGTYMPAEYSLSVSAVGGN